MISPFESRQQSALMERMHEQRWHMNIWCYMKWWAWFGAGRCDTWVLGPDLSSLESPMNLTQASNSLNIGIEGEGHYDHQVSPPKKVKVNKSESGNILWVKALKYHSVQSDLGWWFLFTCGLPWTSWVCRAIYNGFPSDAMSIFSLKFSKNITLHCSCSWKVSDEKSPHRLLQPGSEESLI